MKLRTPWVLLILLPLVLLGLVLPFLLGLVLERALPQAIAEMDRQTDGVALRLLSFERHWFDSELQLRVEPADSKHVLVYRSRLRHGPWSAVPLAWVSGQGSLTHPLTGQMVEDEWHLSTMANLDADIRSKWHDRVNGNQLDLSLELQTARRFNQVRLKLLPTSAAFPGRLQARALSGSARFNQDDRGDWDLQLQLLDQSLALGPRPQVMTAPDLSLNVKARHSSVDVALQLQSVEVDAGPDHRYGEIDARLLLEHLHRPSLGAAVTAIFEAHKSGLRGTFLVERARGDVLLALPGLLAYQPQLRLEKLRLVSREGVAEAGVRLALPVAPAPGFLANPLSLIELLEVSGQLQLPEQLAQRWARLQARSELGPEAAEAEVNEGADEFLLRLRANQLLLREAEDYRMKVELKQGELTLNGQSMLLPVY